MYDFSQVDAQSHSKPIAEHHEWEGDGVGLECEFRLESLIVAGDVEIDHTPLI